MARPCQARLNLAALRSNLALVRELAPGAKVMAVVKANGYGHGAVSIARALETYADALAVACLEEALELRAAGLQAPILLLQGVFEAAEMETAAAENCWVTINSRQQLAWLETTQLQTPVSCWLKIDTGMHRLGIDPQETTELYRRLSNSKNCRENPVLSTHFACADELDNHSTKEQIERFDRACAGLNAPRSAANSAGLLGWPDCQYDWVRPGYMLYGNSPFGNIPHRHAARLKPVMTLASRVISVRSVAAGESVGYGGAWSAARSSQIATVTIGYGDGYPRNAGNGTPVLVNGQRAPLVGRVSMDMLAVDVTDLPPVAVGAEVVLWGEGLPLAEVAAAAGTIGYELTARMPARTLRIVTTP